jgi:hypothetical protein
MTPIDPALLLAGTAGNLALPSGLGEPSRPRSPPGGQGNWEAGNSGSIREGGSVTIPETEPPHVLPDADERSGRGPESRNRTPCFGPPYKDGEGYWGAGNLPPDTFLDLIYPSPPPVLSDADTPLSHGLDSRNGTPCSEPPDENSEGHPEAGYPQPVHPDGSVTPPETIYLEPPLVFPDADTCSNHGLDSRTCFESSNTSDCREIRSLFLSSSVDARLQFLSWLFEGALSRCGGLPGSGDLDDGDGRRHRSKRFNFTENEDSVLMTLRNNKELRWREIEERFNKAFPYKTRRLGALQARFTRLRERRTQLRNVPTEIATDIAKSHSKVVSLIV